VAVNEENVQQQDVNEQDAFIAETKPESKRQELPPVITIARTTVNYILIAVVFLLVGIFIGAFSAFRVERTYRSWVSEAIAVAMAEQDFAALINASRPPSMDNPDSRFEVSASADHVLGNAEAKITMVEFGDFNCGFCRRFYDETFPQLMATRFALSTGISPFWRNHRLRQRSPRAAPGSRISSGSITTSSTKIRGYSIRSMVLRCWPSESVWMWRRLTPAWKTSAT
jgi:hypothetical protein